jgi:hypothetical protein
MDPMAVEAAWRRGGGGSVASRRWRWRGIEAHAEKERARSMNPATVGEVVGDSPTWTRRRSLRLSVRTR